MRFDKPALTYEQQLDRLIERGMQCEDRALALHYLSHLNYYRLGAYWLPFEADHATHRFLPGTTFQTVVEHYIFDRELRLLVMDAIERVEVSVRTAWAYHLAHQYGPHAHLDASLFKSDRKNWRYADNQRKLADEARRSGETFITHLRDKYDESLPPVWAAVEIMTFGQLSKWVGNLINRRDRNGIAHCYDMDEGNFCSYLHHLAVVRNSCAHHARLWNREYAFTFKLPTHRPTPVVSCLNAKDQRHIYNTLVMLAYLLDLISPQHHWKLRLFRLTHDHGIDTTAMGFPAGFETFPIWANAWTTVQAEPR